MAQALTSNGLTVLFGTIATVLAIFQTGIMLIQHWSSSNSVAEVVEGTSRPPPPNSRSFNALKIIRYIVKEFLDTQICKNFPRFDVRSMVGDTPRGRTIYDMVWRVFNFGVAQLSGTMIYLEQELDELTPRGATA